MAGLLDALKNAYGTIAAGDPATANRINAWKRADERHNMALPEAVRNSRINELGDHYSVGADLGLMMGPPLAVAQELIGRPVLSVYPELGNKLAPSVFNFKTPENNRSGAIDPYKTPTVSEALKNLGYTLSGTLDQYPRVQRLLGLDKLVQ